MLSRRIVQTDILSMNKIHMCTLLVKGVAVPVICLLIGNPMKRVHDEGAVFLDALDHVVLHHPFKNVENRNWPTKYRGRILVHRAKSWDKEGFEWLWKNRSLLEIDGITWSGMEQMRFDSPGGELVGEIDIVDCVSKSSSRWFFGRYGFVLANPVAYDQPIPYRGMPGLFDVRLCHQCKKPLFTSGKFCPKCAEVAVEDDCAPD